MSYFVCNGCDLLYQGNANIALFGIIFLLNVLKIYTYQTIPNKITVNKTKIDKTLPVCE